VWGKPIVENAGQSITARLPPDISPREIPFWVDEMGGVMDVCTGCGGAFAFGFTAPGLIGATLHLGSQTCPRRLESREIPRQ
jgi:hypothetical protein